MEQLALFVFILFLLKCISIVKLVYGIFIYTVSYNYHCVNMRPSALKYLNNFIIFPPFISDRQSTIKTNNLHYPACHLPSSAQQSWKHQKIIWKHLESEIVDIHLKVRHRHKLTAARLIARALMQRCSAICECLVSTTFTGPLSFIICWLIRWLFPCLQFWDWVLRFVVLSEKQR